jgi:nitroreductase
MIKELALRNRSYRRFKENHKISEAALKGLVDIARISASAANLQPLKYIISHTPETNAKIFPCLVWAGYLKDWAGPEEGERPSAYIVVLGDTSITKNFHCDHGIASQSMLLGATEKGLGGCILGSINREKLRKALNIPDALEILLVIALGKPAEKSIIEEAQGDIRYWRDDEDVHHVPKRPLEEIIISVR